MYYKLVYVFNPEQADIQPMSEELPGKYLIQLIQQQENLYTCVKIPVFLEDGKPCAVGIYDFHRESTVFTVWVYKGWKGNVTFALGKAFKQLDSKEVDKIDMTVLAGDNNIVLWGGRENNPR